MQELENEIERAKRRVREMNEKANEFSEQTAQKQAPEPELQQIEATQPRDSSFFLILALIILLSEEKADNKIILALLYLLM